MKTLLSALAAVLMIGVATLGVSVSRAIVNINDLLASTSKKLVSIDVRLGAVDTRLGALEARQPSVTYVTQTEAPCPGPPWNPAAAPVAANSAASTDPVEETPDSRRASEAYAKGQSLVSVAVQSGRWTTTEMAEIRDMLPVLSEAQRQELIKEISVALNAGRIRLNYVGPLF